MMVENEPAADIDLPGASPVERMRLSDPAAFWNEVAPRYRPVVLEGLVADWPVVSIAREGPRALAGYLAELDSGAPVTVFRADPSTGGRFFYAPDLRGLNFTTTKAPLRDLLRELVGLPDDGSAPALYAGSVPTADTVRSFAARHPASWAPAGSQSRIWIGNGSRIATHYDNSHNIACVAAGRRRFTLFPPDQAPNLYVGPVERTPAGQPVSMVDLDEPDLGRFPRFAAAMEAALVADLEPGDAIYVPPLWWHNVRAIGPLNVLVNYWSEPERAKSPFVAMIHAMYAIRELPEAEREAWRAWFDLYAFSGEGEAWAHLPPAAQGVLGPPSPQRDHLIRAYVTQMLGRD